MTFRTPDRRVTGLVSVRRAASALVLTSKDVADWHAVCDGLFVQVCPVDPALASAGWAGAGHAVR